MTKDVKTYNLQRIVTLFVPTTPNPTSGFVVFVPRSQVTELDMPVEEALKLIISLGVVMPKWQAEHAGSELAPPMAAP
jgi:uncharacterized membrane protein